MKLSYEQCLEALKYSRARKSKKAGTRITAQEVAILKELLKQMPDRSVRHLNYRQVLDEIKSVSSKDVAEKLILRKLVDKTLKDA